MDMYLRTYSLTRTIALVGTLAIALAALAAITTSSADAKLVAPRAKCAGQKNASAPEGRQEQAMRCLINFARKNSGSGRMKADRRLERAAGRKSGDVMNCGFSHTACGNPADLYPRRFGYDNGSWQWGENIAWGARQKGTARMILKAWLSSPPHRETLLRGSFDDLGLGLKRGRFAGHSKAGVWVLQVGCNGC